MDDITRDGPRGNGAATSDVDQLIASAQDALTDEMVMRLGTTLGDGLDLLDRVNRSGVGDALPILSELVHSGDLQRIAGLARLVASAQDALSDDIVNRLSATAADSLDLLDRVNRSGVARALPAITQLVENGDLDRLVGIARLIAAMEDSLSDDIVNRLSVVATGLASLVDKLSRADGFLRLIDTFAREDVQSTLIDLANTAGALSAARAEAAQLPPAKGGLRGLAHLARDPGTQEALRFMALVGRHLRRPTSAPG
jgi:uncharacterized protein YjgD (DUF1641 family)